jgi:PKD repeat protein
VTVTQILTPPEVYFTPNNLNVISPALPYTVNFTNLSTPAFGCTYNWLIDGTTYTTENPSHSFATYGMYDVGLTVTNALGSATKTYNNAIRITRKSKTFYEVINYADTPATFHVEVFNEVATSADTIIQAHIFDESINFVQDEIPDEPGLDEWGMRHFYSSINEWGHRIISAVTDWGNRILYNGSTLDNSPVTLFKAQEFHEDLVLSDEWQFGTT